MSNSVALLQNNTSTRRIFPFNNRNRPSTTYKNSSTGIIEPNNNYTTKESIESLVYEILINEKLLLNEKEINPFGAIYLCDLKPDNVIHSYIEKIKYFSTINDVSDSIYFDDGMDD